MFEKLVESILVEYFSEWVDGLDSEKMKVALFGGKVELCELKLKTSSLDKFQLPLTVKAGTIGRLAMKVPWKRLTKESVTIRIEDLYLLVVPAHEEELQRQKKKSAKTVVTGSKDEKDEEDSYALRIRWAKQQEVRVRELLEKNRTEDVPSGDNSGGDTTASWGYREKILHNIMDNVSFEFAKIHIRYEDTTQLLTKNPLALGITIDSITASTTNANGHVTFIDRSQSHTPFVHKIMEMNLAGFYCDDTSKVQDLISIRRREPLASSYIIHPFNTSIKMTVNHDETTAFSIPKFQFVCDIGSINASVTPDQCNDLISVINYVSTHELYLKRIHCRRRRPTVPVKRNAKRWWQYAFFGVQVMYSLSSRKASSLSSGATSSALTRYGKSKPPCDWKLFGVLWKSQKEYIRLHKKLLRAAAKKSPIEGVIAERRRLNELEDILDVDSIVFFRVCATQELELEETRNDSVKKLSNWKARWNSRSQSQESDGLRSLDPFEKEVLYRTISEQMYASSIALAAKELENKNSQTILFAVDVAISSIRISLIEHHIYDSASTTGSTRQFLQFELQQFVFAIFQRNGSSSISSSIKSIQMVDFSQVGDPITGERLSQPLFYSLASSSPVIGAASRVKVNGETAEALPVPMLQHFLDLKIELSETKFKLDCSFEPFRYIHNLSVAAKLQTYFVAQVDVSPALIENAEDALAYSSEWLNNAVFAGSSAPSASSGRSGKQGKAVSSAAPARTVEFNIRLPEVDVLVLTTDTSPILQARSINLEFKSGNLLDTFVFAIEGVTILFYDGVNAHKLEAIGDSTSESHELKLLRHQDGLKDVRTAPSQAATIVKQSDYDLTHRKYSTILRKTHLVFHGEKVTAQNRPPRWLMKCTAPPIYFTLSSAQYRQVLQASASWGNSETEDDDACSSSARKGASKETINPGEEPNKKLHRSTSSFVVKEFDDEDERFGLCIMIPQILIVLEGEDAASGDATGSDKQPGAAVSKDLAIDLVLDIKEVNVEAKFSPSAQAAAVDILSLAVFKRVKGIPTDRKKEKIRTAETMAKVNEDIAKSSVSEPPTECEQTSEPDPVYDPTTGAPTCKLLEVGPKASFVLCSTDPFKGKIKTQRVVLYWDQDLLVALFRSYLLGNPLFGSRSATSSRSSSRSSSGPSRSEATDDKSESSKPQNANAAGVDLKTAAVQIDPLEPFGLELQIERWFIYCRPHCTQSSNFTLKLCGKRLFGDITTLNTPYVVAKLHAKGGVALESSRLVSETDRASNSENETASGAGEDVCQLLSVSEPLTVIVESAGYGVLTHRTGAATYVNIHGSDIELNYVSSHFGVFGDYLQNQLISFFNWVSMQTLPAGVIPLDERTKIDADFTKIRLLLPRGAIGNPFIRQKKPERMEMDIKQVLIKSRPHPDWPRMEQLRIQVNNVHISTCMIDSGLRAHTDAIGSVDEAVASAKATTARLALEHQIAASKTRMFSHKAVFIEYVALPIVEDEKKKRRRKKKETAEGSVPRRQGFKDIEDVAREMEKLCGFVKVTLHRPLDWDTDAKQNDATTTTRGEPLTGSAPTNEKRKAMRIETNQEIDLALDLQQLKLFGGILNENFAECEILPRARSFAATEDEYMDMDVQVLIGDVNLTMLCSNSIEDYREKKALSPEERAIALVQLKSVKVLISGYSSQRAQYRVVSSKASLWNVDLVSKQVSSEEGPRSATTEKILTSCAEMYSSSDAGALDQCIDITIDQHEPPADPSTAPLPQDIRVHVETCALTPAIIHFASRVEPFLFCKSQLQFYTPPPQNPSNVSVTTGAVHCMLAKYYPGASGSSSNHDIPAAIAEVAKDGDIALHLILSGCFVVRYSDSDANLQHVQIFGRKMSFEIAAQWPPEPDTPSSIEVPPSPSPSPTCSLISPSLRRVSTASRDLSSEDLLSLADYRRVLCDDFTIDMDMIDTLKSNGVMKISASLTHFHAVLCVFDMLMISHIANFDFEDKNSRESAVVNRERAEVKVDPATKLTAGAINVSSKNIPKTEIIVNMILEDASATFVREIGEYFTPVARLYTFCAMCKIRLEAPSKTTPSPRESSAVPATDLPSNVMEIALHFSEDNESELRDDEGMSVWGFNTLLGSWEPVMEPWTFVLAVALVNDHAGKVITSIDLRGSNTHSLSVNLSPTLLDSFCAIVKEMEQLLSDSQSIQVSRASVISCGFYLANDCGVEISYWVSDNGAASHTSRGFSYAPRQKRVPELLLPRHKVPLKLSTAIFHSLPADQTVSFSWGNEDWHPLTDVRIHSAGKYVYSVLPRSKAPAIVASSAKPAPSLSKSSSAEPPVLLALFDISSVFGYRTLTVSSLVRVFNDTDIAIDCGMLAEDGKSVTEIGTIEAHGACGIPITLVKAIASVRVLVKPHKHSSTNSTGKSSDKSTGTVAINAADVKDHRWSNELFISEKEDCTEHFASCSLILDDFDCKCQRMFDGSQPLHVSQICRANGSFFRVWNRMFTASNASSLRYSQMRVLPPLTFENKCGVALFVVVFVFKKVRRAGAQDREYFHLVASEKIPPRNNMQFLASSLHESTYCSVSMTGFSWSKLFLLPTVFPQSASIDLSNASNDARNGSSGSDASPSSSAGLSSTPSSPSSSVNSSTNGSEVLCILSDFRSRQATINVAFVSASQELNAMRKVIIQPRFVVHNDTPLPLLFEPRAKVKSKISNAKAFFSLTSAVKKQAATCCGSPQLELIHSKLNALNGATTTPASPTARSTVFKGSQGSGSSSGTSSSNVSSSASIQEEMEFFYCSESNFLNIQLEGNTIPNSGVQQFRLDAAMGGANSSLRLFDEGKKLWYDLVAILEQIDSFTTKVTFVERYLILNRTHHEILCMPACDIVPSSHHGQEHKQTPASPNATVTATAAVVAETSVTLCPTATTSFNWCLRSAIPSDSCIRLKIQGGGSGGDKNVAGWRWSGKFSLHEVGETALKMSNKYTNQVHVLRVEIRVESSVRVYVVLTSEDTAPFPLYRIVNSSASEMIHFKQCFEGGSGELSEHSTMAGDYNRGVTQRLLSGESNCFGWDEAYFLQSLERVLVVSYASNAAHSKILLDQPGEAQRVEIPASKTKPATQVYVHWYLNGVTKTIHIHDTELARDKLTGKQNAPPVSDRTESSSSVIQRAATSVSELNLNLTLPSVLLSVLNSKPEEVLLFSAKKLELAYAKTVNEHDQCEVKIGSFQLDNQLENAVFPVIFTPVPSNSFSTISFIDSPRKQSRPMTPPTLQERKRSNADGERTEDDDDERFLHMSIFRLSYGDDVEYIKYFSAMLQPARLQIDDFLIISVASLFTDCMQVVLRHYPQNNTEAEHRAGCDASSLRHGSSEVNDGIVHAANASSEDASIAKIPPIERRMYIETLQLHPMKIHITFQQNNLSKATFFDDQATILLPMVFMILKSNLVNIDCASLNLNALHIYHSFTTRAFMFSTIQQHYAFQGILQIYALVGAADILGNPIGLVTNLGTGVKDFFYEPVAGMVKSPQEFVLGLSRGTASLVKNSVYGTFNAASKFTGTLSSGIAALSMDSKYINERNTRNRQEVPTHFGTGLLYGTKQLGQGILAGVSGVITAPAMGAYNNGLTGFVEGMGRGLIGVAIKPAAGVLDLAARTTAGITATATVFDKKARNTRIRLPRMMHTSDKRLRVYSGNEAMISQLLHKLPQKLLQNEHYEAHVFLPQSRAVIATSHQFLHVDFSSLAAAAMGPSPPRITWKCPLTSLWGAQKTNRGVSIMIGTATNVQVSPHMTTLVTKSSMSTVLVPLRDTEMLFAERVVKCVAELVARQRERATPATETYAAPPPRNSIGLVLEPVRESAQVQGYEGSGGQVVDVFVGSACFRAGVEVGDIIVGFGGKKLERGDHGSALRYQLSLMKKGDMLELTILRNGETKTIKVATE